MEQFCICGSGRRRNQKLERSREVGKKGENENGSPEEWSTGSSSHGGLGGGGARTFVYTFDAQAKGEDTVRIVFVLLFCERLA